MFLASILYLSLLMAAMVADRPARRPTPVGPPPSAARHSPKGPGEPSERVARSEPRRRAWLRCQERRCLALP